MFITFGHLKDIEIFYDEINFRWFIIKGLAYTNEFGGRKKPGQPSQPTSIRTGPYKGMSKIAYTPLRERAI